MKIDDTYEIDLKSTTTFNRFAIVDVEVTMKKPDDESENYKADSGKIYVNGEEITGGGYPEPTGTIEITENGLVNVKDYAEANVNVSGATPVLVRLRGKIREGTSGGRDYYYVLNKTTGEEQGLYPSNTANLDTILYEANLDDFSITDTEIDNILTEISTRTEKDKYIIKSGGYIEVLGGSGIIQHKATPYRYESNPNYFILNVYIDIIKEA